jgi:hypothetical protein
LTSRETPRPGFRIECLKTVIQNGFDNYKENARITSLLDDKAQKTGAMAGVFLAATFGFLSPEKLHSLALAVDLEYLLLILFTVAVFIGCVASCLSVMWARNVALPVSLEAVNGMTQDILRLRDDSLTPEIQEAFFQEQIAIWRPVLDSQMKGNKLKAGRLVLAQRLLGCGMFLIAILLIIMIVNEITSVPKI